MRESIGGMTLRIGDTLIDGSVATQLAKIEAQLRRGGVSRLQGDLSGVLGIGRKREAGIKRKQVNSRIKEARIRKQEVRIEQEIGRLRGSYEIPRLMRSRRLSSRKSRSTRRNWM